MKRLQLSGLLAIAIALVSAAAVSAVKEPKDVKCPVSGQGCDPAAHVDFAGGKVWLCCENCVDPFKNDSAKFAAKAHQQMVSTGQLVQKGCPFSGNPVKPGVSIAIDDTDVGFCCPGCRSRVEKASADERVTLVFGNIAKGFAPAK